MELSSWLLSLAFTSPFQLPSVFQGLKSFELSFFQPSAHLGDPTWSSLWPLCSFVPDSSPLAQCAVASQKVNEIKPVCFCCSALPQLTAELPGVSLRVGPRLLTFHQNCSFPAFTSLSLHKARTSADKSSWFPSAEFSAAFIFSLKLSPTSLQCHFSLGHSAWESSPPSSPLLWAWNVLSFIPFAFFCCCTFSVVGFTHRLSYLVRWNSDLLFCSQPAFACLH